MQRRLLYPLLVLLVAVVVLVMNRREDEGAAAHPAAGAPESAPSTPPGGVPAPAASGDGVGESRQALVAPPDANSGRDDSLRLLAVQKEDGQPLPGTEFFVLDGSMVTTGKIDALYATDANFEKLFTTLGRRFLAGADGSVRLPRPARESALIARHQGRFGTAAIPAGGPDELVVELEVSATLGIRVTGTDGAPAAGVPLGLRPALAGIWLRQARTGADGRADFDFVRTLLPALPDLRLVAGARLLLAEPLETEIDLDAIPATPIELVLPATGAVEVLVRDSSGAIPAGLAAVILERAIHGDGRMPLPGRPSPRVEAKLDRDGRARFEWVGLGLELVARASFADGTEVAGNPFVGPALAGQRVEFLLDADSSAVVLLGRLLQADGSAVARAAVDAALEFPSLNASGNRELRLMTDPEGRFRSTWPLDAGGTAPDRLVLSLRQAGEIAPSAVARVPLPAALGAGQFDLGEILLEELPVLVAGRLVDPDGAGIPGATLQVEERIEMPRPGGAVGIWQTNFDWLARTDDDGAFSLRGRRPRTPVRLVFRSAGYLPIERPFQVGETGLLLQAQRSASLHGSLLLAESVPASAITISAIRSDIEGPQQRSAKIESDGAFSWGDLAPGSYAVRIAIGGSRGGPLFDVDGVLLEAGRENRDPRLQGIDLRQRLRYFVIELEGEGGEAIPSAILREYGSRTGDGFFSAMRGRAPILTTRWPLDLVVEAQGYRPELLNDVSADRKVVLRRGLKLILTLEELPALAAGERIGVSLVPVDGDGFASASQGGFDQDGRAELVLPAPGAYRVLPVLWVRQGRTRAQKHTIGGRETATVIDVQEAATPQEFQVWIDSAALEQVRAGLEQD